MYKLLCRCDPDGNIYCNSIHNEQFDLLSKSFGLNSLKVIPDLQTSDEINWYVDSIKDLSFGTRIIIECKNFETYNKEGIIVVVPSKVYKHSE